MTTPTISISDPVGRASAPVLVLGPSLGTSAELWAEASALLRTRWRVLAWDLPGHGAAAAARSPFTVADIADAVAEATRAVLNRDGRDVSTVCFAGVSLGGSVSLEMALRHPSLVGAIALIASGAQWGDPGFWIDRAETVRTRTTSALEGVSAQRWFAPGFADRSPVVTNQLLRALRDADDESYALCCEALAAYDARDRLGEVSAPALVLWGEHDVIVHEAKAREVASGVARGEAIMVEGVGHLPPAEAPAAVVGLLTAFLDTRADAAFRRH